MKLTHQKLKELIKDEDSASKLYKIYGFDKLAKDESNHKKFLQKILKRS